MRLQRLNTITIVFFILIACLSLTSSFTADYFQQASDEANETRRKSLMYADMLLAGSKFLTETVRSFAATGKPEYKQAYHDEVTLTRSRDKAVDGLKALGVPPQELALIEHAKKMSDNLIDLENRAFAAGDRGDLKQAVDLVYGPEYQQALQTIYQPIDSFRDKMQQRTYAEAAKARRQAKKKRATTHIINVGSYSIILLMVIFIYQRKIVRPIVKLSCAIQSILQGDSTCSIAHLDDENEIGDLARSLEQYRKVTQDMDAQNWIETNTGKVVASIQQAQTQADLAGSLLSYVAPLLDVGYAALYVYDPLDHRLCLSGGYGYPSSGEETCFAIGESLVGQCAKEKALITLTDLPDNYIRIRSSLGDAKPRHLCLLPILLQDRLLGVVELASFRPFNPHEQEFLTELMCTLAMTMEVLNRNLQTQKLLQETQEQAQRMEKQAALLEEQAIEMEAQQAELKETEAWYRSIIESAPQGMLVSDESGTIILCNPKAEVIFGYDRGDLLGRNVDTLVPSSIRSEYPFLREKFLSSDGYQESEPSLVIAGVRRDGSEFPLEASLSLLSAFGGHDKCVFISLNPASEFKPAP